MFGRALLFPLVPASELHQSRKKVGPIQKSPRDPGDVPCPRVKFFPPSYVQPVPSKSIEIGPSLFVNRWGTARVSIDFEEKNRHHTFAPQARDPEAKGGCWHGGWACVWTSQPAQSAGFFFGFSPISGIKGASLPLRGRGGDVSSQPTSAPATHGAVRSRLQRPAAARSPQRILEDSVGT